MDIEAGGAPKSVGLATAPSPIGYMILYSCILKIWSYVEGQISICSKPGVKINIFHPDIGSHTVQNIASSV